MGRVAVDFGGGQGAKRSVDIHCDLGQASNAGQREKQRNPAGREAEGQLAALLTCSSPLRGCASLAPCHPPFCLAPSEVALILALACVARLAEITADIDTALRALATAKIRSNATHPSISTVSLADARLTAVHNNCLASDKRRIVAC